ncbi:mandelate racemase/muconate lactonizing enzyme family protein [Candidatus Solirubrobacter pratensis]|uniref:mandelate racemase/muconate lactonizing enzyme family protein n=1 Tax=Candidatus Solirubrobacter pratensis TaxID=1298857 RepID=UPI000423382E|nr:enolase C-terminal domain-like protein [Candidatus Solirubrobacter pratensis]
MLTVRTVKHRLRTPLRTAWGTLLERETLHVTLRFGPGDWGEGEAAPLEPYDGVPLAAVRAALDAYALIDAPPEKLLAACRSERDLPQALAAIDLALWDRRARLERTPIAKLIAPDALDAVPVNATIGAEDRTGAAAAAATAARAGFTCVKVKVGIGDDGGRVAAVRAAAPGITIRVDANGAWTTPNEALANLRALAPIGVELCEEPVHGVEALREVRGESPVPIAMDETHAPGSGAADAVCLKITRGGITGVLEDAQAARAAGSDVYLASTYDGPLGLRAGLHAAAGLKVTRHCGLATGTLPVREGRIVLM